MHTQLAIHHIHRPMPHTAGAHGVVNRVCSLPHPLCNFPRRLRAGGMRQLLRAMPRQSGLRQDAARHLHPPDGTLQVVFHCQEVGVDQWQRQGVCTAQPDRATALWAQHTHMAGKTMPPNGLAPMVDEFGHHKMQLQIRPRYFGAAFQKSPCFRKIGG